MKRQLHSIARHFVSLYVYDNYGTYYCHTFLTN